LGNFIDHVYKSTLIAMPYLMQFHEITIKN